MTDKENPDPFYDPQAERKRADEIDARLREARRNVEKSAPGKGEGSGMSHRQTAVAYRVLVDMIAGLLVGGFLGYWLDRWLGWAPWGLVTMLLVGFVAGANNAWRAIRSLQADANKDRKLP
ncbi:MAG: AtpZ/AtpI family protein [Enhydrobacter sp.]|nr:MAG: AtpZ/AtpI family protein [Enhydrobacter sp.]